MIAYHIVKKTDDYIIVSDDCEISRCMSLTNGAEHLVKELFAKGDLNFGMRLGYYDTNNILDEIIFDPSVLVSNGNCSFKSGFDVTNLIKG